MRRLARLAAILALAGCTNPGHNALQGYAEGEYVKVAAPFAGQLQRLSVKRGDQVKSGDPLFALEQANEAAARREAADRLSRAQAQVDNLRKAKRVTEIEAVRAELAQAEADLKLAEANLKRQEELFRQKFISQERLDDMRTQFTRQRARVQEMRAQVATATLPVARADEIRAAEAEVAAARAALAQADWRLDQKAQRAPQDALVQETLFVVGEWVPAGAPVVSLLPPGNIKVRFFVPESQLGAVRVGQPVQMNCDGCAVAIPGTVTYIAPQAEFTPPVIYSRERREKLVFLVEARPPPADATKLHPGQPVEVTLK
ncbi:MAG TPA: HlyD family efflux transporter periplasmic adaptor subunit [Burkholderiales bacterium]|nr:HlyD family efflux transporter periplasmic adaptor subunit [Burkholderiales bacterium]